MIEREIFRKSEGILYRHFRKKRSLERLNRTLTFLERKTEQVKKDIHECNIEIDDNLRTINYNKLNIKTSDRKSVVEDALIESIERLQNELSFTYKKKVKIKIKARGLERKVSEMDNILKNLSEEELKIAELKYNDCFSNVKIAKLLHCSEFTIRRNRNKIIEYISNELNVNR